MGNSVIWYLPEGSANQVKIDLGRKLRSRVGPNVQYSGSYSQAIGGASTTVIYGGRMDINIGLTWQRTGTDGSDTGSGLRRKLFGLQAHLKRGGSCTLAEDVDYAWAAWGVGLPQQRDNAVRFQSPVITSTIAAGTSPLNREIYIHTDADSYLTEMHRCTAVTSTLRLTIEGTWKERYNDCRWVLVREAGTYPCMRVPEPARSQTFLTHRDDRVFFLDLPLEEDPDFLEDLAQTGATLPDETETAAGGTLDLPDFDDLGRGDMPTRRGLW